MQVVAVFGRFLGFHMFRIGSLAALAAAIWLFSVYGPIRPAALGLDAPATEFSAARAGAALGHVLGAQKPHPVGSPENTAVRERLIRELSAMGLSPRTDTRASCWADPRWNNIPCGTVTNVIAGVTPGAGKQVALMAHYDSVAAGPGGCDDGCGVATLLETIRTLKARGVNGNHPIVAVFTDGEEPGLLGAAAYFRDPHNRAATGMVLNVDDRGNRGISYLFQTSHGDARLVDLYARVTPHVATSSLYAEIFKHLPNDTDMTTALRAGLPGYNFAMIGDVAQYHTPLDRRENIETAGLQQHGEAVTALAQALSGTEFDTLKGGDAIYLDVLGRWLPRLPIGWALPLSIACFVLIALAGWLTPRERRERPRPLLAFAMPPLLLAGCIGMGYVLHILAAWISGHADPSFAHPVWLRLSLAFSAFAVALLTSRGAGGICGWLWFAGFAIGTSLLAPGAAPYFLFPSLVAAVLLLVSIRGGRVPALFLAALAGLVIWIGLLAGVEDIMGLKLHQAFMAVAAFGLLTLLPLLGKAKNWGWAFALCLVAALGFAVTAGLQPAFSAASPQQLNLRYVEQDGKAWWTADPVAKLPQSLREVMPFSANPERHFVRGYAAPAGAASHPTPSGLKSISFQNVTVPAPPGDVFVSCATPDCGSAKLTLIMVSPDAITLTLISHNRGLPPGGERLIKARPPEAVPSQEGDVTLLTAKLAVPAR
jgi:peptidase M28-like protein